MSQSKQTHAEVSRRRFLAMGGAAAASGLAGPLLDPLAALGATSWPKGRLTARDAVTVKASQFMPTGQFRTWNAQRDALGPANQKGLRATGSPAHEGYVDDLRDDLVRAGVSDVRFESVPFRRWTTDTWGLDLLDGAGAGPVQTASYIPYSGQTSAGGVSGQLVLVPKGATPAPGSLAGKVAVFEIPELVVPLSFFTSLSYPGAKYDPDASLGEQPYKRPYLSQGIPQIEAVKAAGAVAAIGILNYPYDGAKGSYFPYDGVIRGIPGVWVDRVIGAALKERAEAGASARVTLPAKVAGVNSRNLLGVIPGRSKELVVLHCHTDGTNAIEDNAPAAIVAMAQYLTRLPTSALPRTILIALTTGHFAAGLGVRAFRKRHAGDLMKRVNGVLTIEHLGLANYEEVGGTMVPTGRPEPGAIFGPSSPALIRAGVAALKRADARPSGFLKPLNDKAAGTANEAAWPGEGQYFYAGNGVPTANYITGPTYLLNWGITTLDKVDQAQSRREAMAFTEMLLRMGRTDRSKLRASTTG